MAKDTNTVARTAGSSRRRASDSPTQADRKLTAAERKAAKIIAEAEAKAAKIRAEAEEHAHRLVLDARATADGVRAEGMELVSNLREMGDVLRSNAERLLTDIQTIHSRMVRELDQTDPDGGDSASSGDDQPRVADEPAADELDVPDFIPRG